MARWIHEFRSTGERALSEDERVALRRRAARLKLRSWTLAVLASTAILGVVLGIAVAAGGNFLGWGIVIASGAAVGYLLSWAGNAEKLALLHRRAVRVGLVEGFRRVHGDETVRRIWEGRATQGDEPEDEEGPLRFLGNYWSVEERFEESLARSARGRVETFDAVGRDGAVLWVEGRPVRGLIESFVWETL